MTDLYEALEICLKEIEQGADIDTVLFRYPDLADELRPMLETSFKAKELGRPAPSQAVVKSNRAKLLQHAAQMREQKIGTASRRAWSVPLRRTLVTLVVLIALFAGGTGLVRASSNTLPGDNLYPVKRTWEDVQVFFTFNSQQRQALELEHENERLDELHDLFAEGRSASVTFSGYVTSQTGTQWQVSGISIFISPGTQLPNKPVLVGAAVRISGHAQGDGTVMADRIELLPPNIKLPEVNDQEKESGNEVEDNEDVNQQPQQSPVTVTATETPHVIDPIETPEPESEHKDETIQGIVSSVQNDIIVINNISMDIGSAEVNGTPAVGVTAKAEGYFGANGIFIVKNIEFKNSELNNNDSNSNTSNHDSHSGEDTHSDGESGGGEGH